MPRYIAKPVEVEALVFDGTRESIAKFMDNSYAFGDIRPARAGSRAMVLVAVGSGVAPLTPAYEGDVVICYPEGVFGVFDPSEFERRFAPRPDGA